MLGNKTRTVKLANKMDRLTGGIASTVNKMEVVSVEMDANIVEKNKQIVELNEEIADAKENKEVIAKRINNIKEVFVLK